MSEWIQNELPLDLPRYSTGEMTPDEANLMPPFINFKQSEETGVEPTRCHACKGGTFSLAFVPKQSLVDLYQLIHTGIFQYRGEALLTIMNGDYEFFPEHMEVRCETCGKVERHRVKP